MYRLKTIFFGWIACISLVVSAQATKATKEVLRWGADGQGGAPHIFFDPKKPEKLTGFEYEIAKAIAEFMGKELQYCPNDWEMLVAGLQRKQYDILMNAVVRNVWRKKKAAQMGIAFSKPYYITFIQATVAKNSPIQQFSDCNGKKIGILKASKAEQNAIRRLSDAQTILYDDEIKAYADLNNHRLDCVLTEHPEALYYASVEKDVRLLKEPISRLEFSIMVRAEDQVLLAQLNAAIDHLKQQGTLRSIYERWGLWNEQTATYFNTSQTPQTRATQLEQYLADIESETSTGNIYLKSLPFFTKAAWLTLRISFCAMLLAMSAGFLLGVLRTYSFRWIQCLVATLIEIIRGTPLMILLLFIFYGLPKCAPYLPEPFSQWVCMSPFLAGVLGLAINYSAYEAEIYRAGFLSIPIGQIEAARALGMTHLQALWYVIFPQTIRTVLPPITNDFIMLIQDSSLVSMITLVELSRTYQLFSAENFDYLSFGLIVVLFYLLLGLPFTRLSRYLEKKLTAKTQREV